jgi:hypothetical protein
LSFDIRSCCTAQTSMFSSARQITKPDAGIAIGEPQLSQQLPPPSYLPASTGPSTPQGHGGQAPVPAHGTSAPHEGAFTICHHGQSSPALHADGGHHSGQAHASSIRASTAPDTRLKCPSMDAPDTRLKFLRSFLQFRVVQSRNR